MSYQGPFLEDYRHGRERATLEGPRPDMRRLMLATAEREIERDRQRWFTEQRRLLEAIVPSQSGSELGGYVLRWHVEALVQDASRKVHLERFVRGAFAESIAIGGVVAVVGHDASRIIARQSDGSLRLVEDSAGLRVEVRLGEDAEGKRAAAAVRRGECGQWSFSFVPKRESRDRHESGYELRRVFQAHLVDVSLVSAGAYYERVSYRPIETVADLRRQLEAACA